LNFRSFDDLYAWSITHRAHFWSTLWEFFDIRASQPYETVLVNPDSMLESRWFQGARFNFAEHLLRYRDDGTALLFKGEDEPLRDMSYRELHESVARLAHSLKNSGVKEGDRVVGFMPNMIETVIAMLATTSMGAIWSSCSPDFGIKGVLDRFGQVEPTVLFTANGYTYKGKKIDSLTKISGVLAHLPTIKKVVVVPYTDQPDISHIPHALYYDEFLSDNKELNFTQLPFSHPLYILYTSGTTGIPKCMVHGAGGTLLQHLKELVLHTDLKREDTIFYFTTCGWMMWNWLVSSLAVGSRVVLFDGNPFYPDSGALFQLAENAGISIFGTSAKYLAEVEKAGLKPGKEYDLHALKALVSTGSPLSVESYEFVYRDIKKDIQLSSISGGSDIISCFALGNPIGPVHAGELQVRGLGMKVEVYDEHGKSVTGEKGELVCTASFPSQPIYFWKDEGKQKYRNAYFDVYENVWLHGDFAEITPHDGMIIYGRSDATLNPGGVRIGTAEIYEVIDTFGDVMDSLVVGQPWENDIRVILFVKLRNGIHLNTEVIKQMKTAIRENCSPRHVPAKIIQITDIPYTISGKKVEIAVRKIIEGKPVYNRDALANPEALDLYEDLPDLQI
ncbi:MAG: acetoacetate--CoA ligase, partial [Theionarchaea archaeon]|nr:acetoacetate--CoA ligase [Theionarchaea archaeon]